MFNFFDRKEFRRVLKRKDSDAGERGRALEELRASLFSRLQRQQQFLVGPAVALTFNFVVSVSIILMNKLKVLALTIVSIGVAVATVTDLQFHLFGACIAVAWIIPSAVNKILWSNLQQQDNWNALALMWKTTPITLFFLVILMPYLDPPGVLSFDWSFNNSSIIFASAILGFLLQWSGALALGETSAVTHVILGQFKTCVIVLGGFLLFGSNPGTTSICGAVTALGGMSFYTHLNLRKQQQSMKKQASFSLPKSKLGKENVENHDHVLQDESV